MKKEGVESSPFVGVMPTAVGNRPYLGGALDRGRHLLVTDKRPYRHQEGGVGAWETRLLALDRGLPGRQCLLSGRITVLICQSIMES